MQPKRQLQCPAARWASPERGCLFDSYDAYGAHSESAQATLPEALLLRPRGPGDATLLLSCSLESAADESSHDLARSLLDL